MSERNPIRRHGTVEGSLYAALPMNLARNGELSFYARSVAMLVWSHSDGYETSSAAIADHLSMNRRTVAKALDELDAARWLAIEKTMKVGPSRKAREVGRTYHVQHDPDPFTEAVHRSLSVVHGDKGEHVVHTAAEPPREVLEEEPSVGCAPGAQGGDHVVHTEGVSLVHTKVIEEEVQTEVHSEPENEFESDTFESSGYCEHIDAPRLPDGRCTLCGGTLF